MTSAPRVALVLGAGGVAGGAFHAGLLAALHESTGWDPRDAVLVVGTSAGSIAAAGLRAGLSASDMLAQAEGRELSAAGSRLLRPTAGVPAASPLRADRSSRRAPPDLPSLARAVTRPFAARPLALLAGLLPEGEVSTDVISQGVAAIHPGPWPADPLWICTVRRSDGRRTVFGRGRAEAPLPAAVAASCAIPGFFRPVTIHGTSYIDGGVHSPTNADVVRTVAGDVDLVLVSSPMSMSGRGVRLAADQPARRWAAALLAAEVRRLRRLGIPVLAFQPTAADAAAMGPNAMDLSRRGPIARHAYESALRRLDAPAGRARLEALASLGRSRPTA